MLNCLDGAGAGGGTKEVIAQCGVSPGPETFERSLLHSAMLPFQSYYSNYEHLNLQLSTFKVVVMDVRGCDGRAAPSFYHGFGKCYPRVKHALGRFGKTGRRGPSLLNHPLDWKEKLLTSKS